MTTAWANAAPSLTAGTITGQARGVTASVPITVNFDGDTARRLSFTAQITTNGSHPVYGTSLGFSPSIASPDVTTDPNTSVITVYWPPPDFDGAGVQSGTKLLGNLTIAIPSNASPGEVYTVNLTAADYTTTLGSVVYPALNDGSVTVAYYTLSISGSNGTVDVNSVNRTLPYTVKAYPGATVNLNAVPAAHYHFTGWTNTDNNGINPTTVTMSSDKNVTVGFALDTHVLTVSVSPSEAASAGCSASGGGTYDYGATAHLSATAASGWNFTGWTGSITDPNTPVDVTVDGDKTITANFSATVNYTLSLSGPSACSVQVNGTAHTLPWSGSFGSGAVVNLTAVEPTTDWAFYSWTGSVADPNSQTTTVTMSTNQSVAATYMVAFNVTYTGTGSGSVSTGGPMSPPGGPLLADFSDLYFYGSTATVLATADPGSQFVGWFDLSDHLISTANPKDWAMVVPRNIAAKFNLEPDAHAWGSGSYKDGTVRCDVSVNVSKVSGVASGTLTWYNTKTRKRLVATSITSMDVDSGVATIVGIGTLNGVGGYAFTAYVTDDSPDHWRMVITDASVDSQGDMTKGSLSVLP